MTAALTDYKTRAPSLQMDEAELINVLQSSLYPGADPSSIKLVISYCKAGGMDPLQKPVHIVPMWDGKAKRMRDVIMPGIGLYRTQAARTGCAGVTEPEFGPDVTGFVGNAEITYPAWCRVTVKRKLADGDIVEFTAKEFWKENYAVRGGQEKSIAPNAMWMKRPYGQIAKCAEAQALRKAFPEVGSAPTADEMDGKSIHEYDTGEITQRAAQVVHRPEPGADLLQNANTAAAAGVSAYQAFWKSAGTENRKLLAGEHERLKALAIQADKARTVDAPAPPAAPDADRVVAAPVKTFDEVMAMLCAAATEDALYTAAEWIESNNSADASERAMLNGKFDERLAAMREVA